MDGVGGASLVFVIGATNRIDAIDPAFLRPGRYDRKILIGLPSDNERITQLLKGVENLKQYSTIDVIDSDSLVGDLGGFTPADIKGILDRLRENVADAWLEKRTLKIDTQLLKGIIAGVREEYHSRAVALTSGSSVIPKIPEVYLKDIGGYDDVKNIILSTFIYPIRNPEIYKHLGIKEYPGMVLYGQSGTGKTTFAKAVATESGLNFIQVRPSDILSGVVGEGPKKISQIFEMARASKPSIIYFDEMEAVFSSRGSSSNTNDTSIINQLLIEIDGIGGGNEGIYLLGSTNHLKNLDPAVIRPGRFGLKIEVGLPVDKDRGAILRHYIELLKETSNINIDIKLEVLIKDTEDMSGAEIREIFQLLKGNIAADIIKGKSDMSDIINIKTLKEEIKMVKKALAPEIVESGGMYM